MLAGFASHAPKGDSSLAHIGILRLCPCSTTPRGSGQALRRGNYRLLITDHRFPRLLQNRNPLLQILLPYRRDILSGIPYGVSVLRGDGGVVVGEEGVECCTDSRVVVEFR